TTFNKRAWAVGYYAPGSRSHELELNIAIDTSGSVQNDLGLILGCIQRIAEQYPLYRLRIMQCDAEVTECLEFSNTTKPFEAKKYSCKGGGGTAFTPVFEYIKKNKYMISRNTGRPIPLIYITDGFGDSPSPPPYPVLWVLVNSTECSANFGKKVKVTSDSLVTQ
ncbi:MAG: VWA-like domain-containing protein, partial [Rectinema sp.]|nr:VWA-like domain-containing protein [Rectinema sp.]